MSKLVSDFRKPNGHYVVPPEQGEAFVEALPVTKFYGVAGDVGQDAQARHPDRR